MKSVKLPAHISCFFFCRIIYNMSVYIYMCVYYVCEYVNHFKDMRFKNIEVAEMLQNSSYVIISQSHRFINYFCSKI